MKRLEKISSFIVMDILHKARQYEDTIHMEVGEPDLDPSPLVQGAALQAIREKKYYYTSALGLLPLREKIAEHYYRTYNISLSPSRIIITPGTSGAFLVILSSLLDTGDKLALSDPSYPCYKNFAYFLNADPVFIPVSSAANFEITVEHLKKNSSMQGAAYLLPFQPLWHTLSARFFYAAHRLLR